MKQQRKHHETLAQNVHLHYLALYALTPSSLLAQKKMFQGLESAKKVTVTKLSA